MRTASPSFLLSKQDESSVEAGLLVLVLFLGDSLLSFEEGLSALVKLKLSNQAV